MFRTKIFDLYLRDKFNLFVRSYPSGQSRIFKDYVESTIRGLHNKILRNKVCDYLATHLISGKPVNDFETLRSLVKSITNRALARELDSPETAGTSIQLMNYSYVNSEDAASSKGASKNRYKVNHFAGQDTSIEEINAFRQFRKFNKFKKSLREANEDNVCYQCDKKGHFARNCPRNMLTKGNGGVNQVGETNVPGLMTSSKFEDSTSEDEDPKINYVKNGKFANISKYQKHPRKFHKDKMNAIIESQNDQISSLTKQMSDLMAVLASKPAGAEANTTKINSMDFPEEILDINKDAETDIFHFL